MFIEYHTKIKITPRTYIIESDLLFNDRGGIESLKEFGMTGINEILTKEFNKKRLPNYLARLG